MFTPKLGRVSVQNASASPGAWAQLHPDKPSETISSHNCPILFHQECYVAVGEEMWALYSLFPDPSCVGGSDTKVCN